MPVLLMRVLDNACQRGRVLDMKTYKPIKVGANIKTRDYLMLGIIQGKTKGGVHKDHKKEQNRRECRNYRGECA